MTDKKLERIVELVAGLCEAFGRAPSEATFMAYEIGMEGMPMSAIEAGVRRAIRESRFMPSPSEIRELAGEVSAQDRATIAWDCVLKSLHLGPYKHVSFNDDRVINATIRNLGGWPTFLSRFTDAESEKWVRKEFLDTYKSLWRAQVNGEICLPLPGLAGGSFPDGKEYVPKIAEIGTPELPALPAPSARRVDLSIPRLELKKP